MKTDIPATAKIGFSVYEANGEGYSKWWSFPEGKYLGRVDESLDRPVVNCDKGEWLDRAH